MSSKKIMFKKSLNLSFAIITGLSTIAGLWGYAIKDLNEKMPWWQHALILFGTFVTLSVIIFIIYLFVNRKAFKLSISGKDIYICKGDIFKKEGLILIPFNEYFGTKVDDVIISHRSLNGKMIDSYVDDVNRLNDTILKAKGDKSELKPYIKKGKTTYPLGRIIKYDNFMMLAMSHFDDQNRAYINVSEYETMLMNMWGEIRRVYAGNPIVLPLIGGGLTTINGMVDKDYTTLLKCILCTLKRSKFIPDGGITIVLTEEAFDKIDVVKIKEVF